MRSTAMGRLVSPYQSAGVAHFPPTLSDTGIWHYAYFHFFREGARPIQQLSDSGTIPVKTR